MNKYQERRSNQELFAPIIFPVPEIEQTASNGRGIQMISDIQFIMPYE